MVLFSRNSVTHSFMNVSNYLFLSMFQRNLDASALWNATFTARASLYLVSPEETTFAKLEHVPNWLLPGIPFFTVLLVVELVIIATIKGLENAYSLTDLLTSTSAGLMSQLPELFGHSAEMLGYVWIYNNFCIYSLPLDSYCTWLFALLAVDFCYYAFHRASHEINILWAFHQTHHSSEYMNFGTGIRQAAIQKYGSIVFYYPLALLIPPPITYAHFQLNFIYGFWLHTELIGKLGPLEWVLNTPSHHRVHHARNPYAIDKNYSGVLIIWDRIFGTFAEENDGEKTAYGLVHNVNSFDAIYVQFNHFYDVWKKMRLVWRSKKFHGYEKFVNLLKAVFYGPGWFPKKPHLRLGDPNDLPPVEKETTRYETSVPLLLLSYCFAHHLAIVTVFNMVTAQVKATDEAVVGFFAYSPQILVLAVIIIASLASFGFIMERRSFSTCFEICRCSLLFFIAPSLGQAFNAPQFVIDVLQGLFAASIVALLVTNVVTFYRLKISNPKIGKIE